jgi:hydroxymethylbilane synthase
LKLKLGTRRSPLALLQTERVRRQLERAHPQLSCEVVAIETSGDRVLDRPLREVGGKGLFVKELDEALRSSAIDCAVHSLKDVPSELAPGIALAAVPERVEPHDLWISASRRPLGADSGSIRLGTTSLRRAGQARARNPQLSIGMLRGNVETRLAKVRVGDFDATLLAAAGIARLGVKLDAFFVEALDPWSFVPAPGQGALGLTARIEDDSVLSLLAHIDDPVAAFEAKIERAIAARLGGACDLPLGAFARVEGRRVRAVGIVVSDDGSRLLRSEGEGDMTQAQAIAHSIAEALIRDGAHELLAPRSREST